MSDYQNGTYDQNEDDLDMAANNSAKLFERSRIKALSGKKTIIAIKNVPYDFDYTRIRDILLIFHV